MSQACPDSRRQNFFGNDAVAVAMRFAMRNGQSCFSLRKFLAILSAIRKSLAIALAMPWCTLLCGSVGNAYVFLEGKSVCSVSRHTIRIRCPNVDTFIRFLSAAGVCVCVGGGIKEIHCQERICYASSHYWPWKVNHYHLPSDQVLKADIYVLYTTDSEMWVDVGWTWCVWTPDTLAKQLHC